MNLSFRTPLYAREPMSTALEIAAIVFAFNVGFIVGVLYGALKYRNPD
jgi:hypothetical protein